MRYSAFFVLLLAIGEPLLAHAKVVVVIPQQTRRSTPPWRSGAPRYRKSSHGNDVHYHKYHGPPSGYYQFKKPVYSNSPFPHGGDDFDQGHEHVNHVKIPYGKGISHAITFGKGYVPYDKIKGSFSLSSERYPSSQVYHKQPEPEYVPSSSDYSPAGQSYESSSDPETFFADPESAMSYNERRSEDQSKLHSSRSPEKDLMTSGNPELADAATNNEQQLLLLQQKATELYKNVVPQPQDGGLLPSGVPSATIGGSKEGIVLRDTVALDEYQQKLQEMTKAWPNFLSNTALGDNYQSHQVSASYSTGASPISGFSGSINWPVNFAQPKQGYDVKEDIMEPQQDFRSMSIQTSPYQAYSVPAGVAYPTVAQMFHG